MLAKKLTADKPQQKPQLEVQLDSPSGASFAKFVKDINSEIQVLDNQNPSHTKSRTKESHFKFNRVKNLDKSVQPAEGASAVSSGEKAYWLPESSPVNSQAANEKISSHGPDHPTASQASLIEDQTAGVDVIGDVDVMSPNGSTVVTTLTFV